MVPPFISIRHDDRICKRYNRIFWSETGQLRQDFFLVFFRDGGGKYCANNFQAVNPKRPAVCIIHKRNCPILTIPDNKFRLIFNYRPVQRLFHLQACLTLTFLCNIFKYKRCRAATVRKNGSDTFRPEGLRPIRHFHMDLFFKNITRRC